MSKLVIFFAVSVVDDGGGAHKLRNSDSGLFLHFVEAYQVWRGEKEDG